jgi:peptidyl-prolyl cis-trans isomerase A (cyclophilin A)
MLRRQLSMPWQYWLLPKPKSNKEEIKMFKKLVLVLVGLLLSAGIASAAGKKNPVVLMETNMGNVKLELFEKEAPISVKNFLDYVDNGFYNGTIFHRVIPGFMIQGGGFTSDLKEKSIRGPIKNEAINGLKNTRGSLAMARTAVVDSATAQFFINVADNDFLNHRNKEIQGYGYAVFGKVLEGMDVVDKIAAVKTVFKTMPDMPEKNVVIKTMKVLK